MPELASLLDPLSLADLAMVVALTLAGSIVAGLSGLGGGVLIAMAITPIVGVKPLVPTVAVAMLVNHLARIWVFRREAVWPSVGAVLVTAVPTTVVGALVYVRLPADTVAVVIGCFLLSFVPLRRYLERRAWRVGHGGLAGIGVVFGFVSGTTIGGGVLIVPALLGSGLSGAALIGTDAFIGLTVLVTKAATFGTADLLTPELTVVGLVVGLCSVPGIYLARLILSRTSVRLHVTLVEIVIVCGGVWFLWRGLIGS